jgi:DNA adenine methylase
MVTSHIKAPEATSRPFLKWAGGKAQLLPALLARAPASIATYFEPFAGGGALFFALMSRTSTRPETDEGRPRRAVLNDLNAELVATYEVVRDAPEALTERLTSLQRDYMEADAAERQAMYYRIRASRPRSPLDVAARVVFLNKTCFNGLYRVNREGTFNVPHGRYRAPRIADHETLLAASAALQGVELRCADFEEACEGARSGDFVYFDPPFHPLSNTSSFTAYTQRDFGNVDQIRLKRCIDGLTARGVAVLISNSPHPWIRGGYEFGGYRVEEVPARRAINSRGDRRGPIGELVITNREVGAV